MSSTLTSNAGSKPATYAWEATDLARVQDYRVAAPSATPIGKKSPWWYTDATSYQLSWPSGTPMYVSVAVHATNGKTSSALTGTLPVSC